jgi:hypothetical protein
MKKLLFAICALALAVPQLNAQTQQVQVTVTSNAPDGGVAITPLWVGFHDGSFDLFDPGAAASSGLALLAEEGNGADLTTEFTSAFSNGIASQIGSASGPPPIQPGQSASAIFNLDSSDNSFISYASMILPSSDYFVANGNPTQIDLSSIFGNNGSSISFDIGTQNVWDAGSEVNDFGTSPGNGLFPDLGLPAGGAGLGDDEGGTISLVTGDPYDGFLNSPSGADFSLVNFNDTQLYGNGIATVTITAVPEPTSLGVVALGLGGLFLRRRRS